MGRSKKIPEETTGEERAGFERAKHWCWEVVVELDGMLFLGGVVSLA